MLVAIGLILGPELFVFMPEVVFLIEGLSLEFIGFLFVSGLAAIRSYCLVGWLAISSNPHVKKVAMIVLLVVLTPFAPELLILIDAVGVELALTGILLQLRTLKDQWTLRL